MNIKFIRRGKEDKSNIIYACLYNDQDQLIISATLDYIVEQLKSGRFDNDL